MTHSAAAGTTPRPNIFGPIVPDPLATMPLSAQLGPLVEPRCAGTFSRRRVKD